MAADFKSHILRRDEKGIFGVPFKRWLLAGVSGGMSYTIIGLLLPFAAIPFAIAVTISSVWLTHPRGGLPLWQRLIFRLRGWLLLRALRQPDSLIAQSVDALNLPVSVIRVSGDRVFAPLSSTVEVDLREWITFAYAGEEDGLIFVDSPLQGEAS